MDSKVILKRRIGNDISFSWSIMQKDNEEYDLTSSTLHLFIKPEKVNKRIEIKEFTVDKNIVNFTFKAEDQTALGKYYCILQIEDSTDKTVDYCYAIQLVPHSYMESNVEVGLVNEDTVELTSTLQYVINAQGTIDLSNYYTKTEVDNLLDNVSVDLSAYYTKDEITSLLNNIDLSNYATQEDVTTLSKALNDKQDTLVSGTNIKTINGETILGDGDLTVQGMEDDLEQAIALTFIAQHKDDLQRYTKTDIDSKISSLKTSIANKYVTNTALTKKVDLNLEKVLANIFNDLDSRIPSVVYLTQTEYDALTVKEADTIYYITE